nr:MAG TPA: hypothetical protein [Caudoviricetes sp.]
MYNLIYKLPSRVFGLFLMLSVRQDRAAWGIFIFGY